MLGASLIEELLFVDSPMCLTSAVVRRHEAGAELEAELRKAANVTREHRPRIGPRQPKAARDKPKTGRQRLCASTLICLAASARSSAGASHDAVPPTLQPEHSTRLNGEAMNAETLKSCWRSKWQPTRSSMPIRRDREQPSSSVVAAQGVSRAACLRRARRAAATPALQVAVLRPPKDADGTVVWADVHYRASIFVSYRRGMHRLCMLWEKHRLRPCERNHRRAHRATRPLYGGGEVPRRWTCAHPFAPPPFMCLSYVCECGESHKE